MSIFGPLKNSTIYVAEPQGLDDYGDPTGYGTRTEVQCQLVDTRDRNYADGGITASDVQRITTDEYEFSTDTMIWLPGADETDPAEGEVPQDVGRHEVLHVTLFYADL